MLLVIIGKWKPEKDKEIWKALAERRVPLPEDVKVKEYYVLLGQHKMVAIAEVPDEKAVAVSSLNWADLGDVEYNPAVTATEYMKMRSELLK